MAKNFFGNSWNEFDTPFNNSGPLTDRPSRLLGLIALLKHTINTFLSLSKIYNN